MKILLTVALLVIAVSPAMGAWEWPRGLERQVKKANELHEQGKNEEALELLNDLVAGTTPLGQARVYASIAEIEQRAEHHLEAQSAYEKALALNALSPYERFVLTEALDDEYLNAADHERGRELLRDYLNALDDTVLELPKAMDGYRDIQNSREAIEATRGKILYRLARHDEAEGKTLDAVENIEAAISFARPPPVAWREYKVDLLCSIADPIKCAESIFEFARTLRPTAEKAEEFDQILKELSADPTVTATFEAARAANLISENNELVRRLPPGYVHGVFLVRVFPIYPPEALTAGISGWVEIEFQIDTDGKPSDAKVVDAEPPGVFDSAALTAFSRWRYQPVIVDGKPVAARSLVLMVFRPQ